MSFGSRAERPAFLIVGGPNGSGKSSAYEDTDIEAGGRSVWIVNPDVLTVRIQENEHLALQDANLAAVRRIEAWAEASIEVHKTIGVETVLSTDKYRRLVAKAKERGFEIWLIYVLLDSVELNVERVKLRVRKGRDSIDQLISRSLSRRSDRTKDLYVALIRAIFRKAMREWGWIETMPAFKTYGRAGEVRVRYLTQPQAEALLANLPEHQREVVLFALSTGLRQRNVLGLSWDQVDLRRRIATIPAGDTKNGNALGGALERGCTCGARAPAGQA